MQVYLDIEGFTAEEDDAAGISSLLAEVLVGIDVNLVDLTDLIISQNYVGCVLKVCVCPGVLATLFPSSSILISILGYSCFAYKVCLLSDKAVGFAMMCVANYLGYTMSVWASVFVLSILSQSGARSGVHTYS